jgi:hypothetical protein
MTTLHTFHDGSVLKKITARALIAIPIWKGNPILNTDHVTKIQKDVGTHVNLLDSGYCIIHYPESDAAGKEVTGSYIIDGQHRAAVLRTYYAPPCFEPDFELLVKEKTVASESEAISYFNVLNSVKPQQWAHDKKLIANEYIVGMEALFNTTKRCPMIRQGITHRPYLSVDKLRDQLILYNVKPDTEHIKAFLTKVQGWNKRKCEEAQISLALHSEHKDASMWSRALEVGFMLAMDFSWLSLLS